MVFHTAYQKKSAIITSVFMLLVLLLLFFCGFKNNNQPEEYGVAINFGTSNVGSGPSKINKTIASKPVQQKVVEKVTEEPIKNVAKPIKENVLTQEMVNAPKIVEEKKKIEKKEIKPTKKAIVKEVAKKIEKPKPTKETQNALNSLFGEKNEGESSESEGDDLVGGGVKGAIGGDSTSNKYYGNNGSGGTGNYLLSGRKALVKPINKPVCNEEGVVVVRVEVDNRGKVIKAVPGVKGTTNNSNCLLEPAKKAALATKWNADENAPNKQVDTL